MIAVGESFKLGKELGLDPNNLYDVLSTSTGHVGQLIIIVP